MNINFRLWDAQEKMYFNIDGVPSTFKTSNEADDFRDTYLHQGNYVNKPMCVISIHKFDGDKFISEL